jgi:histone H3/H4
MAKKKTTKKATKKTTKKKETLVVGSKTKEALKGTGKNRYNVSSDTLDAINEQIYMLIEQAQKRCAANGRKTIRPYDILA